MHESMAIPTDMSGMALLSMNGATSGGGANEGPAASVGIGTHLRSAPKRVCAKSHARDEEPECNSAHDSKTSSSKIVSKHYNHYSMRSTTPYPG